MQDLISRRSVLGLGALAATGSLSGCIGGSEQPANGSTPTTESTASDDTAPETPLNGEISQQGGLSLSSPAFDDGEPMDDSVGYRAANENPELTIEGVPEDATSLVMAVDDPDARPVTGHVFTHWTVWNIDPAIGTIPRGWSPENAVEGFNDFGEQGYGGPAPPEGSHRYRFKLLALDTTLGLPPETRKTRLGSVIAFTADVLASTQLVGTYAADQ